MSRAVEAFDNTARREISRQVVALLKDYVGRGPRNARTFFFERLVVVLLDDTLTKAESTLAEQGGEEMVREIRRCFATAMEEPLVAVVEAQSGHTVHAMMADYSVCPDYAFNAFLLEAGTNGAGNGSSISLGRIDDEAEAAEIRRRISDGVVALFKDYVGRGPRQGWTFLGEDVVVTLISDALTKAEQTLAEKGRDNSVSEIRREFQAAMKPQMISLVEEATDRRVDALLSDHAVPTDFGIEVFVLDPESAANGS